MRSLYNILFAILFCISAPYYFLKLWRRGNWRRGFRQRFGRFDSKIKQALSNRHVLWIHAVSVGEVNVCTQLIRTLEARVPNLNVVVSTTTSTGMGELRRKLPSHIEKIYYPIDHTKCVQRALSLIHPEAVVLVEAEIWPNFIWRLRDKKIPLFLVNARLSDRSFRGYNRSEEHTSELQSHSDLVCRLLLEKRKKYITTHHLQLFRTDSNPAHRTTST